MCRASVMKWRTEGSSILCFAVWMSLSAPSLAVDDVPTVIRFDRDVRPILSDQCFQCHGPDAKTREAELRLDQRDDAIAERDGVAAIVDGHPDRSELIRRIVSADSEERMPPAATGKQLNAREIEVLRRWIHQGAKYQPHWAFVPPADVSPSAVDTAWVKNPIDQFVHEKLQQQGLIPSEAADPRTLIRRMYLDLIGLLPDPDAVDSFVVKYARDADAAVRHLAGELLANPHYGERWGRHWLDQARYADSHGYTIDGDRVMWPYRDWVIRAVNDDMPFDRFTIEQLAGDLLPEPSKAQLVATGFHRNTLINQEGGTDNEQFRNEEVVDRVNTTAAVWLGLTLGCAQCHNHKFDPISQKEFYEFFAFFNHTADVNNVGPTVEVSEGELLSDPDPVLQAELAAATESLADVTQRRPQRREKWEQDLLAENSETSPPVWRTTVAAEMQAAGGAKLEQLADHSILAGQGGKRETYTLRMKPLEHPVVALRLRVLPHSSLPQNGPGRAGNGNFVLSRFEVLADGEPVAIDRCQADHAQPGFAISNVIDGNAETGWAINIGKGSRPGMKMNAPHEAHFLFEQPVPAGTESLTVILRHEINDHYNIGHFAIDVSETEPASIHLQELLAVLQTPDSKRSADQRKFVADQFAQTDRTQRDAEARVARIRRNMGLGQTVRTMVMKELDQPRETWIHVRGNFLRKDKETGPLAANVPGILPAAAGEQLNRLDLARWLVRRDHPLTARVTVNRIWMRYFGRGLVETENDFGTQGAYPTHPKLLDWLANYLVESDWSVKALHDVIVTSATYRQSSHRRADLDQLDPRNLLLGRQNRLRVDAEIIRDIGLSASGLLNSTIGGPSVRPPQPDGVYSFTQTKKSWTADQGENRFRRALYTRFYRSAPYPMMTTFDAPDFQSVCTRRPRSNTPLQSLTMANDKAFFEMAQGLAARLLHLVSGTDDAAAGQRIREAFRICFSRPPTPAEASVVLAFQQLQLTRFSKNAKDAEMVAPAECPGGMSPEFAASWTAVARGLMNTDEFMTRE